MATYGAALETEREITQGLSCMNHIYPFINIINIIISKADNWMMRLVDD